jgi:hypothetical protein
MLRRGLLFEYDTPDGWEEFRDGNQFIYHGPDEAELIVSGTVLQGTGSPEEISAQRHRLLDDATRAVRKAADHPELLAVKELRKDEGASALECWTMASETRDGLTLFSQAIVVTDVGVLLVTLESAKTPEAFEVFRRFLKTVRPVVSH